MSSNEYGNQWKYMITHFKKAFKAFPNSETYKYQSKQPKSSFQLKILKACQKIKRI